MEHDDLKPVDFVDPIALPPTEAVAGQWQRANRRWWESHPMRYDWRTPITAPPYSQEWFQEIDRRFFMAMCPSMPWARTPFDRFIPFAGLRGKTVLEIGVGMGSHAQLLSSASGRFIGVDLTGYAATASRRRFDVSRMPGLICRMDGECLGIRSHSVDFVWSWGVIHHSANPRRILGEIHRVLKPDGAAVTMVYHRSAWLWWVVAFGLLGLARGRLLKAGSIHRVLQEHTDGALARHYTPHEWHAQVGEFFHVERMAISGQAADLVPLPAGRLKSAVLAALPDRAVRWLCNDLRMGSFLVSFLRPREVG